MYTNLPHAEQARGLYIDEINRDAAHHHGRRADPPLSPPWRTNRPATPPSAVAATRARRDGPADAAAAPRGLDTLMASMLRISRMLLGLCIGDHDVGAPGREALLQRFEERVNAYRSPVSPGARESRARRPPPAPLPLPADAHDGLPEAVRETINRLSEQWSLLTQALSPSAIPLGLAMLFCRSLPSSAFKLKASPSDVAALETFRSTERGRWGWWEGKR